MNLKDSALWARPEQLWADLYTGQDPRCVRVIPVEALRKWVGKELEAYRGNWSGPINEGLARNGKLELLIQLLTEVEGL